MTMFCECQKINKCIYTCEISPGISLEGMMLKLKLQYFGHLMRRVDSLEKTLMLGGIGGQEEKGTTEDEMASPTQWTWVWVNSGSWWWTGRPGVLWFMGSQKVGHDWATDLISSECSCEGAGGPRGAILHSRSGGVAVRRYPSSKVRSSGSVLLEQLWRDTPRPG